MTEKNDIHFLFELLDDDNEQSASLAMAELLSRNTPKLEEYLRKFQESDNPRMRRRIHQLQSALGIRRKRQLGAAAIDSDSPALLEGMIVLHLTWFDNDLRENVLKQWNELCERAADFAPDTLESLALFMKQNQFTVTPRDNLEAEYYCIGSVLDDKNGSDLISATIAFLLARKSHIRCRLVRCGTDFALLDADGYLLFPSADWQVLAGDRQLRPELWTKQQLLRFNASVLLLCATATDSFRYFYTVGSIVSPALGKSNLDYLPYPYHTAKRNEGAKQ